MVTPMLAEMSGSIHVGLCGLGSAIGVGLVGRADDTDADPADQMQLVKRVLAVAKTKNQTPTSYVDVRIPYKSYYK